jgi:hypothetical protein
MLTEKPWKQRQTLRPAPNKQFSPSPQARPGAIRALLFAGVSYTLNGRPKLTAAHRK